MYSGMRNPMVPFFPPVSHKRKTRASSFPLSRFWFLTIATGDEISSLGFGKHTNGAFSLPLSFFWIRIRVAGEARPRGFCWFFFVSRFRLQEDRKDARVRTPVIVGRNRSGFEKEEPGNETPGMKGGSLNGLRGKLFLLTIFVLMCTSIFLWGWEKTPLITPFLAQEDEFEIPSPVSLTHKTDVDDDSSSAVKKKEIIVDQGEQSFNEQEVDMEEHSSIVAEVRETNMNQPGPIFEKDKRMDVVHMGDGTTSFLGETKGCNYGKGKWVADSRRPLYSGFSCKQWLSEMWACRLTQRTDFSYEGFRWQPQNCEMPEFEGSAFLRKMQDKSLALVGDSLGRQQFQSLMCMITGGKEELEVEDVGREYGLVKTRGAIRPDGWAYRFTRTNTTILYYWSASLCELEPLNINDPHTEYAMHLDQPATFLREFLHRFDVLVLNTGHHWNRGKLRGNRWVMYVGGKPNQDKAIAEMGNAKNFTVYSVAKWLDSQLPNYPRLKVFFRTISPRHFANGDWNSGGSCDNTTPLAGGNEVSQEESSDPVIEGAVRGTGVKLLDITALSQLRDECHISRYSVKATEGVQDCLHWCLPGVPDTWNEILSAQI